MNRFQNPLTPEKVLIKAQKFCLYRERSEAEMERKMKEWGATPNAVDDILNQLIEDRFVSNERFSEAYTRGKFNVKRWGKVKIRHGLKMHKISEDLITKAFLQIDADEYTAALEKVIQKKLPESIKELTNQERYELKGILYRTAVQKGYESDLIFSVLDQIFKE
tara:strand:+ start:1725 stop:2216 length:492 start_codon:yes stop_codon:yes gene_type:complete